MKIFSIFALIAVLCSLSSCKESTVTRTRELFTHGWAFYLGDIPVAFMPEYDDSEWRKLDLPHDWSVEGEFSESAPSGVSQGALPTGVGWYRKRLNVSSDDLRGRVYLEFDGIYRNGAVYINGSLVGRRPYGYSSVIYDVSQYLKEGSNVVAVRVDNSEQPSSRWYSGSGIYRNVWLTKTNRVRVAPRGTWITTPLVNSSKAKVIVETKITNDQSSDVDVYVSTSIYDDKGHNVAHDVRLLHVESGSTAPIEQEMRVNNPKLWDVDSPSLYRAETIVSHSGEEIDKVSTTFGIRSFYFDHQSGFILNDKHIKLNGVCLHHDLGCLGAVVNVRAIERRLQLLKDMGCNAIRSSHNPPAPEFLDLCDKMGFLVVDEAFDVWHTGKVQFDYSESFDDWGERDLADMIYRDRNHPSIVLWSIGNEVREQWEDPLGRSDSLVSSTLSRHLLKEKTRLAQNGQDMSVGEFLCKRLVSVAHRCDPTRFVSSGCNNVSKVNYLFKANALDVIGFNYNNSYVDSVQEFFPGRPFVFLESTSALMTRGFYKMPSTETFIYPENVFRPQRDASLSCSAYDNCHTPNGSSHERAIIDMRKHDFVSGQFVWTGFDYLGEPTPYVWPVRSSHFGIIDLAGFPKDVYYLYQSEWQTEKTVLHLFPHWNWKTGDEVDMWCYYNNADEVELFINGRSCGVRSKDSAHLHAFWRVVYEPGTVRVVSRKNGKVVAERNIVSAGRPHGIRLKPDRKKILADGNDLCFVTVEVIDKDGNVCPQAQNIINFEIEGTASVMGVDNGCPFNTDPFQSSSVRAFAGKCSIVLRNSGAPGNIKVEASAEGLKSTQLTIHCLDPQVY